MVELYQRYGRQKVGQISRGTVWDVGPCPGLSVIPGKMKEYSTHKKSFSQSNTIQLPLECVCIPEKCTEIQAIQKEGKSVDLMALSLLHWAIPDALLQCALQMCLPHLQWDQNWQQQGGVWSPQFWGMTGSTELWNTEIAKCIWELLTYMATIPFPTAAKCKCKSRISPVLFIHRGIKI